MSERDSMEECLIFVTRSKEYLCRGRECVRVRDRRTGLWEPIGPNRLLGTVRRGVSDPEFVVKDQEPRVGDCLCLLAAGTPQVSAPILRIEQAAFAALQVREAPDGSLSLFAEVMSRPSPGRARFHRIRV